MINGTLKKLISPLNSGQGHDNILAVLLKSALENSLENLSYFFNACFMHCYLPHELLKGIVTLILKDYKKNSTDSCNYRPIMQSSCLLRIFELFILDILFEKLI